MWLASNLQIEIRFQKNPYDDGDTINSLNAKLLSYRNQSIVLQIKSIDWFLYDGNFDV